MVAPWNQLTAVILNFTVGSCIAMTDPEREGVGASAVVDAGRALCFRFRVLPSEGRKGISSPTPRF
jgi:hypothetical protein